MKDKSMIECRSCKQTIDISLDVCPSCGQKTGKALYKEKLQKRISDKNKWGIIFFVVFVISVVYLVIKGNELNSRSVIDTAFMAFRGELKEEVFLVASAGIAMFVAGGCAAWSFLVLVASKSTLKNIEKHPESYRRYMK